jgi:hypothetical protein
MGSQVSACSAIKAQRMCREVHGRTGIVSRSLRNDGLTLIRVIAVRASYCAVDAHLVSSRIPRIEP